MSKTERGILTALKPGRKDQHGRVRNVALLATLQSLLNGKQGEQTSCDLGQQDVTLHVIYSEQKDHDMIYNE